jgi:DNA-binding transcriptional MerR regulator
MPSSVKITVRSARQGSLDFDTASGLSLGCMTITNSPASHRPRIRHANESKTTRLEFSIKQAATLVGVTPRTLRHYGQIGLIPEPVHSSGGLIYSAEHILRLLRIIRLTALGLSLDEVSDILRDPGSSRSSHLLTELDRALADRITELQEQRRIIDELCQTQEGYS